MRSAISGVRRRQVVGQVASGVALALGMTLVGCGTPGAPMPPSLKLPAPVNNLVASRTGDVVSLTWTMPRKTTDKLLIAGNVPVRVCRKEGSGPCQSVPGELSFAPDAQASFSESLLAGLASGSPRGLSYFVELRNSKGRSAGLSNGATVLAGAAPPAVQGLSAEMRKQGVMLRWNTEVGAGSPRTLLRLQRKLLDPLTEEEPERRANPRQGLLAPEHEAVEQSLLVDQSEESGAPPGRTLDKSVRFGRTYDYRAQYVVRIPIGTQVLELVGPLSAPVEIKTLDVFPPAIPTGLAAVATQADTSNGGQLSIDLSWQPVSDSDVAGYSVYRREGNSDWQRISPAQPVVGPAFHDAHVEAGHTYRYAVTALDQGGRESARSDETQETVPAS